MMVAVDFNKAKDRTVRQPIQWRCVRCPANGGKPFEFQSDYPECPKCRQVDAPAIRLLALIHLLVPDSGGPIRGKWGQYRLGCHKTRTYLATKTNQEAATNKPFLVNCLGCLMFMRQASIETASDAPLIHGS